MKSRPQESSIEADNPQEDLLNHISGCAFASGFILGYMACKNGEEEPDLEEIERQYIQAERDSVLVIKKRL